MIGATCHKFLSSDRNVYWLIFAGVKSSNFIKDYKCLRYFVLYEYSMIKVILFEILVSVER